MKHLVIAVLIGGLAAGGRAQTQSMSGPNGYPVAGPGPQAYPTPSMPYPRLPYTRKKAMPRKAGATQGKFFPLYPTPQGTPIRSQKLNPLMVGGMVSGQSSRQAQTSPPAPKTLMPPNPKPLAPNNGMVSVMGPRQINYPTLYRNPTPVYP